MEEEGGADAVIEAVISSREVEAAEEEEEEEEEDIEAAEEEEAAEAEVVIHMVVGWTAVMKRWIWRTAAAIPTETAMDKVTPPTARPEAEAEEVARQCGAPPEVAAVREAVPTKEILSYI